jgi:hypothetical protein
MRRSGAALKGDCVLYDDQPYVLETRSDPPGFWIIRDVAGNEILAHESNIDDDRELEAIARWEGAMLAANTK